MKEVKLEIAHFALRWHVAKDDEWEAMGSERGVFLGEVHPSLTRAAPKGVERSKCDSASCHYVGASCREAKRGLTVNYGGFRKGDVKGLTID